MHDVIVANGSSWAAACSSPRRRCPDDGLFDLVLVGDVTKLDFITTSPKLYRGGHVGHPRIEIVQQRDGRDRRRGCRCSSSSTANRRRRRRPLRGRPRRARVRVPARSLPRRRRVGRIPARRRGRRRPAAAAALGLLQRAEPSSIGRTRLDRLQACTAARRAPSPAPPLSARLASRALSELLERALPDRLELRYHRLATISSPFPIRPRRTIRERSPAGCGRGWWSPPRAEHPACAAGPVYPRGMTRSSPISTSTPFSPPSRSSSTRSCAGCRSSSAATRWPRRGRHANYLARASASVGDGLAEALRRCPRPSSYGRAWASTASTRTRSGRRRRGRARRSSRPGSTRATSISARSLDYDEARASPRPCVRVVRARTRLSCSLGVGELEGRRQDRLRPPQAGRAHRRPPRCEARFLAPLPIRLLPGVGPRAEVVLQPPASRRSATSRGSTTPPGAVLPGKVGLLVRTGARHRPAPLESLRPSASRSRVEETFPRDVGDRECLHDELRRMADRLRGSPARAARPRGP